MPTGDLTTASSSLSRRAYGFCNRLPLVNYFDDRILMTYWGNYPNGVVLPTTDPTGSILARATCPFTIDCEQPSVYYDSVACEMWRAKPSPSAVTTIPLGDSFWWSPYNLGPGGPPSYFFPPAGTPNVGAFHFWTPSQSAASSFSNITTSQPFPAPAYPHWLDASLSLSRVISGPGIGHEVFQQCYLTLGCLANGDYFTDLTFESYVAVRTVNSVNQTEAVAGTFYAAPGDSFFGVHNDTITIQYSGFHISTYTNLHARVEGDAAELPGFPYITINDPAPSTPPTSIVISRAP